MSSLAQAEIERLEAALEIRKNGQAAAEKRITDLEAELDHLQAIATDEDERTYLELRERTAELEAEIERLQDEHMKELGTRIGAENRITELEHELKRERDALMLAGQSDTIANFLVERKLRFDAEDELKAVRAQEIRTNHALEESENVLKAARERIAELERHIRSTDGSSARIAELETSLDYERKATKGAVELAEKNCKRIAELEGEKSSMDADYADLDNQHNKAREEVGKWIVACTTWEESNTRLEAELAKARERIATLRNVVQRYVDVCPMCNTGVECQDEMCFDYRQSLAAIPEPEE